MKFYFCMTLVAIFAVVFDTTFAVGNFDYLSIAAKMHASLLNSSGRVTAKSNWTSSLGSTAGFICNEVCFPKMGFNFYPAPCSVCSFVPVAQWINEYAGTRHGDSFPK